MIGQKVLVKCLEQQLFVKVGKVLRNKRNKTRAVI